MASTKKYIVLADGENLVLRYQAMADSGRFIKNPNVSFLKELFIWHHNIVCIPGWSVIRVNYYTTFTGGDDELSEMERQIAAVKIENRGETQIQICPRVFKKPSRSKKSRIVDINICIDALRHSFHRDIDAVMLLSGDGDYLSLIREIMKNGTQIWLGAFSDGLSPTLSPAVDRFTLLDPWFFTNVPPPP